MQINNNETALQSLTTGLSVGDAVGDGDLRQLERALVQRIDCLPNSADVTRVGMVTFQFDDGHDDVYDFAKPKFDAAGEVGDVAIIPSYVGTSGRMTWTQIKTLIAAGWGCSSHTNTHQEFNTLTEAETEAEIADAVTAFTAQGIDAKAFVYPAHIHGDYGRKLVPKYHICGRGETALADRPAWTVPNLYGLMAYGIDAESAEDVETQIDVAYDEGRWLIVYMHDVDETKATKIETLLAYVQNKNMPIVTLEGGVERLGVRASWGDTFSGSNGGFTVLGNGDTKCHELDVISSLKVHDTTYEANSVEVRYSSGNLALAPLSKDYDVAIYNADCLKPSRTDGSGRRLIDLGDSSHEWRNAFAVAIGSVYNPFYVCAKTDLRFYVGNTGPHDRDGTLAMELVGTTGCCNLKHLKLDAQTTPAEPAAGDTIIWADTNGDVWMASNVGGTTKKSIVFDYSEGASFT